MLGKIIKHSSNGVKGLNYLLGVIKNAIILLSNGININDNNVQISEDLELTARLRPVKNHLWHSVLTFHEKDKIDTQQMKVIGQEYIDEMGLNDCMYALILHRDCTHPHFHLLSTRVSRKGELVNDYISAKRTQWFCERKEIELGLIRCSEQNNDKKNTIKELINGFTIQQIEGLELALMIRGFSMSISPTKKRLTVWDKNSPMKFKFDIDEALFNENSTGFNNDKQSNQEIIKINKWQNKI